MHYQLQRKLKTDIQLMQKSSKILILTDKAHNIYRIIKEKYKKVSRDAIISTYKKKTMTTSIN